MTPNNPSKPKNEPTFTIKAKDALAYPTLTAYYNECMAHGLDAQGREVLRARREIELWQRANMDATKLPDHKHVPADA